MVRRRGQGRQCSFESLENRRMMAGDVTATIKHGDLIIKGDSLANGITITARATAGTVVITGVTTGGSATTINGGTAAVTLTGFTDDLKIDMKGGDDAVTVSNLDVGDDMKLEGGDGNDTFTVDGVTVGDRAKINLGNGDDTLSIADAKVTDHMRVQGKSGDDDVTIAGSTFSKLRVSLGHDDDTLDISDTTVSVKTRLDGKGGTNTFNDGGGNSLTKLKTRHFEETDNETSNVSLNTVSDISENGKAAVTGSFTDSTLSNTHAVTVSWGDPNKAASSTFAVPATSALTAGQTIASSPDTGMLTIVSISGSTVTFSVQHQYLNDGVAPGNNTSSDTSTVIVNVTGTGFNGSDTTTVKVNNTTPTVALTAVTGVNEGGSAMLTGSYTDIGLLDKHTLAVSWGDPNNATASTFAITPIQDATGANTLAVNATFNSPTDSAVLTVTAVNTTTGQVSFSVQHRYLDDGAVGTTGGNGTTSDSSTISVAVTDGDGQTGTGTTTVKISNVAPTIALSPPASVAVNATATLTGSVTDPGILDQHPLLVDFGDTAMSQFLIPAIRDASGASTLAVNQTINATTGTGTLTITSINALTGAIGFSVQHPYTTAGQNIPISVSVLDDDAGTNTASTSVTVTTSTSSSHGVNSQLKLRVKRDGVGRWSAAVAEKPRG